MTSGASVLGHTLAHYRITERIGAGGMGEVYRGTDATLGREVALKMLPRELASDPDRLARFAREAKLLASLNHPSIAQLYAFEQVALPASDPPSSDNAGAAAGSLGSGSAGPPCVHLLVMELVEGLDLKQRLDRGPLPVDEALEIALHVAEALEEAHNKGIVHRDLKPANVKLTPDGKVKVLDFGLAKAWAGDGDGNGTSSSALSQSPTLAQTGHGTLPTVLMKPDDVDMQFDGWDDQNNRDYAVTADGQRFLFKVVGKKRPQWMHVLVNWPSLLEPAAKR